MSRYRETLHRWAAQYVPEGASVTGVDIAYDDGYDPTFTDRPESLSVVVYYAIPGDRFGHAYADKAGVLTNLGKLLTELFAIEGDD